MKKLLIICTLPLLLSGCMRHYDSYEHYGTMRGLPPASLTSFPHCSGYDCQRMQIANFWPREWKKIKAQFQPKATSAEKERQQIANAIMVMEQTIGPITGTAGDKGGTFTQTGEGQLDCVDESTNSSTYLYLLQEDDLLHFHTLGAPESRTPFLRWPHQTATITENDTGDRYAVDSWFADNGKPIYVLPLDQWKDGWNPKEESD